MKVQVFEIKIDEKEYVMKFGNIQHEIEILERLEGVKNVAQIYRKGKWNSNNAFITSYYGEDLAPTYEANHPIFEKIEEVLKSIHSKGIIHRDIKPSNICVNSDGDITIIDFDCSSSMDIDKMIFRYTLIFSSINQMNKGTPTIEDDFESLFYTKQYLISGTLPWYKDGDIDTVLEKKKNF